MTTDERNPNGYFPIPRESADLSFPQFRDRYFEPEQPVVIEGVASHWAARTRWNADYLVRALSKEPTAIAGDLWYWVDNGALPDDFAPPEIVQRLTDGDECFPRNKNVRIWVHEGGNVTPWHYDVDLVNIFNVQVTGSKEWFLLSPEKPPRCYPWGNFALIDRPAERMLDGRVHTRFVLNEGDMLYLPPSWFHRVASREAENTSLNWAMTKRKTSVVSAAMAREIEMYALQNTLARHRWAAVRKAFDVAYFAVPDFLRIRWHYDEMIETPYAPGAAALWKRFLAELAALGPTLRHAGKARAAMRAASYVRRLEKSPA